MNQAILRLLGLAAMVVVTASQQGNWEEVFPPPTVSSGNPASSEMNPEGNKEPEGIKKKTKSCKGDSGYPGADKSKGTKEIIFKECRKIKKSGKTAACKDDEIAIGCEASGVRGCKASQTFGAQACAVNKESCGEDFVMTPWDNAVTMAVCCKRNAVQVQ